MTSAYTKTLRYWFDIEALTYPDLPKPAKNQGYMLSHNSVLPWQARTSCSLLNDHKYFMYLGLIDKKVLDAEIFDFYRTSQDHGDDEVHARKVSGKTFLCAVEVSAGGKPDLSTLQLAAFAVAFSEKKKKKTRCTDEILQALIEKIETLQTDMGTNIIDFGWFETVMTFLTEELSWAPQSKPSKAQVALHRVSLTNGAGEPLPSPPELHPINSFYLTDLERLRNQAERGLISPQVMAYLSDSETNSYRFDVTQVAEIDRILEAERWAPVRWPSKFPLFLMQQVAVNTAISSIAQGGIFSVNGPPGTGKTTLLMDVIAARIVERANLLVTYDKPAKAFADSDSRIDYPANAKGKSLNGGCYQLDRRLHDFGIVVASENNKAVENITHDLPNIDKVEITRREFGGEPFDYFAKSAEAIMNARPKDPQGKSGIADYEPDDVDGDLQQIECWGLISVALGKSEKCRLVSKQLGTFSELGLKKTLDREVGASLDWDTARTTFLAALEKVNGIQNEIARYEKSKSEQSEQKIRMIDLRNRSKALSDQYEKCQAVLRQLTEQGKQKQDEVAWKLTERQQQARDWPWWRILLTRFTDARKYSEFGVVRDELEKEYNVLRQERSGLAKQNAILSSTSQKIFADLRSVEATVMSAERETQRLDVEIAELEKRIGTAAYDVSKFAKLPNATKQKSLIRNNQALHHARADVFWAALHLHKSFIKHAGTAFETNFRLALSMLTKEKFLQPNLPEIARDLWATFFLAVPVVSSTFASVSRCFSDLGEGEIGLLLVDEGGQAVPSHAVGALWRSKRAIIVGDPLQVEPVMPMNVHLDHAILKFHGANENHKLTMYSAQHLADSQNRHGAYLTQYDGKSLWVGSPLRVHRRCVDPMFSVSNEIAYNNKMVFGPDPEDEIQRTKDRPLIGPSKWFSIEKDDFEDHFSLTEAMAALELLKKCTKLDTEKSSDKLSDLFVISPFKSVSLGMKTLLLTRRSEWASDRSEKDLVKWLDEHVGTVHAFQGKESEIVILILGGRTSGARSWAADTPNIINVAITRSKRRLYVIGNRQKWERTRFGSSLSKKIQ